MYIIDGIAYAGEKTPEIKVKSVRTLPDFKLRIRFNDNSQKIFDFKNLLNFPCYEILKDEDIFKNAYVDFGTVVWNNGEIDISPEKLYLEGVEANDELSA